MATARIFANEDVVILKCPYRSQFIGELRETIPKQARYWEAGEKIWEIRPEYLEDVVDLCNRFFTNVIVDTWESYDAETNYEEEDKSKGRKEKKQQYQDAYSRKDGYSGGDAWGQVKQFMTKEAYRSLFRVLAKEYHPDKPGGSEEKMQKINALFEGWTK